jgi:hypothetical protein
MAFMTANVNDSLLNAITVKGANHFIVFKQYKMIKQELLKILNELKKTD